MCVITVVIIKSLIIFLYSGRISSQFYLTSIPYLIELSNGTNTVVVQCWGEKKSVGPINFCLLYTSDAADE